MTTAVFKDILDDILTDDELFGADGACPARFENGVLDRVVVISGENAGGKSLFCRALSQFAHEADKKLEVMLVGMGLRTETGMHRAFMFGNEKSDSTGKNSVSCVLSGINTAHERQTAHWLMFDEPDIGLSEGYATALGAKLAEFATAIPERTGAFVVVSHSRGLVNELLAVGAMSVRVGDDLRPVRDWIRDGDLPKSSQTWTISGNERQCGAKLYRNS